MKLVDTHTHIFVKEFAGDLEQVILRAKRAGLEWMLLPNIDLESVEAVKIACAENLELKPMWGLHPCHVDANWKENLEILWPLFHSNPAIAVGEIGLDFYWSKEFAKEQVLALETQLQWAADLKLPVSLHTREATTETIRLVKNYIPAGLKGVFHCFSGSEEEAREIISMGMYLGIGGSLTYPKNPLRSFIANLPLESLVLETDAPYLPPVPYRGKRNEPSWLMEVVHCLAELSGHSPAEIAEITTRNAKSVFNL